MYSYYLEKKTKQPMQNSLSLMLINVYAKQEHVTERYTCLT